MKTLQLLAIVLGFSVAAELPAKTTVADIAHKAFRTDKYGSKKPLTSTSELLQTDFMAIAVLASLVSNSMISKNNSAFRNAAGVVAALHGSAMACELWSKTDLSIASITAALPGVLVNAILPKSWQMKNESLNKVAATVLYLSGQNAVQIADFFKGCWKSGLLNPMPYIRLFTKNRDRSELAAIAIRNLLPLALLTQNGKECYTFAKKVVSPTLEATE